MRKIRRTAIAGATAAALALALFGGLGPGVGLASSHREAPLLAADPQVDATDLYAFTSPDKTSTVTIISNWIPFQEPSGGPNFYSWQPGVHYDINIDNNGDAKPDIIYRWIFTNHYRTPGSFLYNTGVVTSLTDPDLNFYQTYDLIRIRNGVGTTILSGKIAGPSDVGDTSMPNFAALSDEATYTFNSGRAKTFTGQVDDPFFLDLRVFDLVYGAPCLCEAGHDTLNGFNVSTLALQVPKSSIAAGASVSANPVIGVWTTAERKSTRVEDSSGNVVSSGSFVQVSRLGMPLVNEVVVPVGLKDYFNASKPVDDAQFLGAVNDPELPHDVNALYGIPVPDSDSGTPGIQRSDLISVFLTGLAGLNTLDLNAATGTAAASEMLRLNMSTLPCEPGSCGSYSRFGVIGGDNAGFPNGRRLGDDIIDVALRVVEGVLLSGHPSIVDSLGDGVDHNDVAFRSTFPYLALPQSGSVNQAHN